MSGLDPEGEGRQAPPRLSPFAWLVFALGAIGLIGAVATDSAAVIGRHLRAPLLGSVEIVQALVVLAASAAIVAATLADEHASVRLLTERAPLWLQRTLDRIANIACALFFALLAVGSTWLMWDLRDGAEQTELLHIPLFWLRAFWLVCALTCCGAFIARAVSPKRGAA